MMLMVRNVGFPFGFMISASVFMGNVLSASTQTIKITSDLMRYNLGYISNSVLIVYPLLCNFYF